MPTSLPDRDGYINVASSGEGMWKKLCNVLGREDLLAMPEFKDNEAARIIGGVERGFE